MLVATVCLTGCLSVFAATKNETIGGLKYILDTSAKTARLTYISTTAGQNYPDLQGELVIPSSVTSTDGTTYPVTQIQYRALANMPGVTKVTIPASVTSIYLTNGYSYLFQNSTALEEIVFEAGSPITKLGTNPFTGCTALRVIRGMENVSSPSGTMFADLPSLEILDWPGKLTTIAGNSFSGDMALRTINGLDVVTTVSASAFAGCGLETIQWPSACKTVKGNTFNGCTNLVSVTGLDAVTTIEAKAFMNCPALAELTWPAGCKTLNANTFDGCASLKSVPGISVVTTTNTGMFTNWTGLEEFEWFTAKNGIPSNTFKGCTNLKKVTNIDHVTTIDANAFDGCLGLETFAWPSSCKTINGNVFSGCTNLKSVTNIDHVTTINSNAFKDCTGFETFEWPSSCKTINGNVFSGCTNLKSVTNIDHVTTLNSYAFQGCTGLETFTLPTAVKVLNSFVFDGCTALSRVEGTGQLTSIGSSAFRNCTSLAAFDMNEKATVIGSSAFQGCTSLTEIVIPGGLYSSSSSTIGTSAFEGCTSLVKVTIRPRTSTSITTTGLGTKTFKDCTALREVVFEPSTTTKAVKISGTNTFENTPSLETLVFPDYSTQISATIFTGANGLKNLTFGPNTTAVSAGSNTDYFYSSKIEHLELPAGLTTIGAYAFSGMPALKSVTMPANMTNLSTNAIFLNCKALEKVILPPNLETITSQWAFQDCSSLTEITFPESLTAIEGTWNFRGCDLRTLTFPDNLDHIYGYRQFAMNENLTTVNWGKKLTTLADKEGDIMTRMYHFEGCKSLTTVNFPAELESLVAPFVFEGVPVTSLNFAEGSKLAELGRYVFYGMPGLTEVTLPGALKKAERGMFAQSQALETVTFTSALEADKTANGWAMFADCTSLKNVNFADGQTSIGTVMFRGCTSLKEITLPRDLEVIGSSAFVGSGLEKVNYNEKLRVLGDSCFFQPYATSSPLTKAHPDVNVYLPKTLESIGAYVFCLNENAKDAVFDTPNLTTIGEYAFYGWNQPKLDLSGTAVYTIGKYAFGAFAKGDANTVTTEVIFPSTLKTIADYAITRYDGTERITFLSDVPPVAQVGGTCCFGGPDAKIFTQAYAYVPPKSIENYRTCTDSHLRRFYLYNDEFRNRFRPIVDFSVSESEIKRYLPAEAVTLTTTVKNYEDFVDNPAVTWKSDNESVATVSADGTVNFVAVGEATVTATYVDATYGELTTTCRVYVYDHYYDLTVDQPADMYVNDSRQLVANALDAVSGVYVDDAVITWSSSNPELLAVDENGVATALGAGNVAVTASWTDENGESHSATAYLTVKPEDSVDFGNEKQVVMYTNNIHEFTEPVATHRGKAVDNGTLTWESANSDIVMVASDGRIFGCKPGVAMVYAIYNGVKVPCTVTVLEAGMYNLTLSMPDAGGSLHVLGLQGDTELKFVGNENQYGVRHFVGTVTHDDVDVTDRIVKGLTPNRVKQILENYIVSGPLHDDADPAMLAAAAAESGDATAAVPGTTVKVLYIKPLITGVDDIEADGYGISIYAEGKTVHVVGATDGALVTVYDVQGRTLYQGTEHVFTLDAEGVMMLNVDNANYKFILN